MKTWVRIPLKNQHFCDFFMTTVSLLNLRMPERIASCYFTTGSEYHEVFELQTALFGTFYSHLPSLLLPVNR